MIARTLLVAFGPAIFAEKWYCGKDTCPPGHASCVISCPDEIAHDYYCDENDRASYCYCSGNSVIPSRYETCNAPLKYDPKHHICNWEHNVDIAECPAVVLPESPASPESPESPESSESSESPDSPDSPDSSSSSSGSPESPIDDPLATDAPIGHVTLIPGVQTETELEFKDQPIDVTSNDYICGQDSIPGAIACDRTEAITLCHQLDPSLYCDCFGNGQGELKKCQSGIFGAMHWDPKVGQCNFPNFVDNTFCPEQDMFKEDEFIPETEAPEVAPTDWFCGIETCDGGAASCDMSCPDNIVAGFYCDANDDTGFCHCEGINGKAGTYRALE